MALTGAGISTASGIPDFRGPQGRWTLDPDAERISTLSWYLSDADVRAKAWQARADVSYADAKPNAAHRALVDLEHSGRLSALITQNTDGLHLAAGSASELVLEIHGSARTWRCEDCAASGPLADMVARVRAGEADPRCPACGGITRATVILFEENLDADVLHRAVEAAQDCDLMIAVGSTLAVQPVAGLVPYAVGTGARLIIVNGTETSYDHLADVRLDGEIDDVLPRLVAEALHG